MLTIQTETLGDCLGEIVPHLPGHWQAACSHKEQLRLNPVLARYHLLEERGQLLIVTARDRGVLAGYASFFVDHQIHYGATLWAESDVYWVHPDQRGQGVWDAMRRHAEAVAKTRGILIFRVRVPLFLASSAAALVADGFVTGDTVYEKVLG